MPFPSDRMYDIDLDDADLVEALESFMKALIANRSDEPIVNEAFSSVKRSMALVSKKNADDFEQNVDDVAREVLDTGVIKEEAEATLLEVVKKIVYLLIEGPPSKSDIPAGSPGWQLNETLEKVACIQETSPTELPLINIMDNLSISGTFDYMGLKGSTAKYKHDFDSGDDDSPGHLLAGVHVYQGYEYTTYNAIHIVAEEDLFPVEVGVILSGSIMGLVNVITSETAEAAKVALDMVPRPSGISSGGWGDAIEAAGKLLDSTLGKIKEGFEKIIEFVVAVLGPEMFPPVTTQYLILRHNYFARPVIVHAEIKCGSAILTEDNFTNHTFPPIKSIRHVENGTDGEYAITLSVRVD